MNPVLQIYQKSAVLGEKLQDSLQGMLGTCLLRVITPKIDQ
jgi:hypothetical protein